MSAYPYTFQLAPGEDFVPCPYNISHQVTNARYLTHLDKCRQAYKKDMAAKNQKVEISPCRFNWTHQYPKIEIDSHERRCQDQYSIVPTLAYHQHELPKERAAAAASAPPPPPQSSRKSSKSRSKQPPPPDPRVEGENWDIGIDSSDFKPGYNPQEKLDSKCYLYNPMGYSKSERKQFRMENRQRYQREEMKEKDKASNSNGNPTNNGETTRYIPGLNYNDIKMKQEKITTDDDDEWERETVANATPRRVVEDTFSLENVKLENQDYQDPWETETLARSPVRIQDVKEEPINPTEIKQESYDWDSDA